MICRLVVCLFIICFISTPVRAQIDTAGIARINAYVHGIDSIIGIEKNNKHSLYTEDYSHGTITRQTEKTKKDSVQAKLDTIVKTADLGRFSIKSFRKNDTVLRIEYFDNTKKNLLETFYFRDRKMILASVRLDDDNTGEMLYQRMEYFPAGKPIYVTPPLGELPKDLQPRVSISLKDSGKRYYDQIMKGGI
jgi:hypothetical protein